MRSIYALVTAGLLVAACSGGGSSSKSTASSEEKELSEAMGHALYQQTKAYPMEIDIDSLIVGLRKAERGEEAPISMQELGAKLQGMQGQKAAVDAQSNLQKAEAFLADNIDKPGIEVSESGKLQWHVLKAGTGVEVKDGDKPEINYKGTFVDGETFDESKAPVSFDLNRVIPGFKKGIIGMREGETRRLFIHPELGYGTQGRLPPNSLLIFDITVEKANKVEE